MSDEYRMDDELAADEAARESHRTAALQVAQEVLRLASEDLMGMGLAYADACDAVIDDDDGDALERCHELGSDIGVRLLFLARWCDTLQIDVDPDDEEILEVLEILSALPLRPLADSCVLLGGITHLDQVESLPLWEPEFAYGYFMGNKFAETLSAARAHLYGAPQLPDLALQGAESE